MKIKSDEEISWLPRSYVNKVLRSNLRHYHLNKKIAEKYPKEFKKTGLFVYDDEELKSLKKRYPLTWFFSNLKWKNKEPFIRKTKDGVEFEFK